MGKRARKDTIGDESLVIPAADASEFDQAVGLSAPLSSVPAIDIGWDLLKLLHRKSRTLLSGWSEQVDGGDLVRRLVDGSVRVSIFSDDRGYGVRVITLRGLSSGVPVVVGDSVETLDEAKQIADAAAVDAGYELTEGI